jgi:hypothetical protein
VTQYLKLLCGAKAARAAGYSPRRARQQGYDNLRKPKIRRLVRRGMYLYERDWNVCMGFMPPDAKRIPREEGSNANKCQLLYRSQEGPSAM